VGGKRRQNLKTISVVAVLLFGLLLTSAIGASTAAAKQPKSDAKVVTPKPAGETGEIRAYIHVPDIAIERSPVIYALEPPEPPD
jgi:hypothetical protein